jgi:flagellar protein FlaG
MINSLKAGVVAPEVSNTQRTSEPEPQSARAAPKPAPAPPPAAPPGSDLRLVIERDSDNAFYVYRLVDRTTGKVVVELPRDQVAEMGGQASYSAGSVARATA